MERNISDMDIQTLNKYKSLIDKLNPRNKKDRRMGYSTMNPALDRRKNHKDRRKNKI